MSSTKPEVNAGLPDIFQDFPADRFNQLLPTTTYWQDVGPMQRARVDVVRISSDPKDGDVYPQENDSDGNAKKLALTAVGLSKLCFAASIAWAADFCRVEERTETYCRFKAAGALRKPDGTLFPVDGMYEINLVVIEKQLLADYKKKMSGAKRAYENKKWNWPGDDQWIKTNVDRDLLQWNRHMLSRAETGAKNRAIRKALALKNSFTPEEIAKPFAVPRVDFAPDVSDPQVKRFLLEQATGATHQLYPPPAAQRISAPAETVIENGNGKEDDDDLDAALGSEPQGETVEDQVASFAANDMDEQVRIFGELVKSKNYPIGTKDAPSPLRKLWKTDRVGAYRQLLGWKAGE